MKTLVCCVTLAGVLAVQAIADSSTTNVLDGVTTNAFGPFTLGDTGPYNSLLITNGGSLTNTVGTVGYGLEAHSNLAIVTGTNSVWHSTSNLVLGNAGALNQIFAFDGARVQVDQATMLGLGAFSDANVAFVSGQGTLWNSVGLRVGVEGSGNQIVVRDGAKMHQYWARIGEGASSSGNAVTLAGAGSQWAAIAGTLDVGYGGSSNLVRATEGAELYSFSITTIGRNATASNNKVDVAGAGTRWTSATLVIGWNGSSNSATVSDKASLNTAVFVGSNSFGNSLMIGNGGTVSGKALLGITTNGRSNSLMIDGVGTAWTNTGLTVVGYSGSENELRIVNGAEFRARDPIFPMQITVGLNSPSRRNVLTIEGEGSKLIGPINLTVGASGSDNQVLMEGGARVQTSSAEMGQDCNARNNLGFVTGAGTVWSNGQIHVGFCSTNNHLVVSNGAQVFAGRVSSSVQGGASNTIVVTGVGSLLRATNDLILGNWGTGNSLLIAEGGRIEGRADRVGSISSARAHVAMLHGAQTIWSNITFTLGENGSRNRLVVTDGARLESGQASIGALQSSTGNEAIFSGIGTALNIRTNLAVGVLGNVNRLTVSNGATVLAANLYVAASDLVMGSSTFPSHENTVALEGSNTTGIATSNILVGYRGNFNRLEVQNGARVTSQNAAIGVRSGSLSNSAVVTGQGSSWSSSNLLVGQYGHGGTLIISNGACVSNRTAHIGFSGASAGGGSACLFNIGYNAVWVTGPGSLWQNTDLLYIGYGSIINTLNISNGAIVTAGSAIIGNTGACLSETNANRVKVDGGCLIVTNVTQSAVLESRFGSLSLRRGLVFTDQLTRSNGGYSHIDFQGGSLHVRSASVINGSPLIVGNGFHGARLQIEPLSESNDHGNLIVTPGLLIMPHATLAGRGRIVGGVTNRGIIAPGSPLLGSMFVNGSLVLSASSALEIDLGGNTAGVNSDTVEVIGAATLNGRLGARLRNGYVPSPAQVFRILTATALIGRFTNVDFGARLKTADNLGSFLVATNDNVIELRDYQPTDFDGDGIEDAWTANHFGHSPLTSAEKAADADGDGANNYDEFLAGTDPNDFASVLRLSIAYASNVATLSFPCVEGKDYRILSSNDLGTWSEVSDPTFTFPSSGRCEWTDANKATGGLGGVSRFYRISGE